MATDASWAFGTDTFFTYGPMQGPDAIEVFLSDGITAVLKRTHVGTHVGKGAALSFKGPREVLVEVSADRSRTPIAAEPPACDTYQLDPDLDYTVRVNGAPRLRVRSIRTHTFTVTRDAAS